MALVTRHPQCGHRIAIDLVDDSSVLEQQPDDLEIAVLARLVERRGAVVARLVDGRAGFQQQPHRLHVAKLARHVHSSRAPMWVPPG